MMDHMSSLRHRLSNIILVLAVSACGGGMDTGKVDQAELDPCDTGLLSPSWAGWGDGFFRTYCSACHALNAPDRHGAPLGVYFDSEGEVAAQAAAIRRRVLTEGTMPVGGGVPETDLQLLERYLDCGIGDD